MTAPLEVWAYLVDGNGEALSEEQHVVLLPEQEGDAFGAAMRAPFNALPGMADREPVGLALRFANGRVSVGGLPAGSVRPFGQGEED